MSSLTLCRPRKNHPCGFLTFNSIVPAIRIALAIYVFLSLLFIPMEWFSIFKKFFVSMRDFSATTLKQRTNTVYKYSQSCNKWPHLWFDFCVFVVQTTDYDNRCDLFHFVHLKRHKGLFINIVTIRYFVFHFIVPFFRIDQRKM